MSDFAAPIPAAIPGDEPTSPARVALSDLSLQFVGTGSELFGIQFVNGILTIVTLGIYYPWARARELRFMIGSLQAGQDRFSFHGQGRELFLGLLRAWLIFLGPLTALWFTMYLSKPGSDVQILAGFAFYLLLLVFFSFAAVGSLRYRASRTRWRGIRFAFDGSAREFGAQYGLRLLLTIVTLGLAYPIAATWRRDYFLTHARFGSERFEFDGKASDLMRPYVLCWLLLLPTFGLSMTWFHGFQQAYYWNHTRLAGGKFSSTMTGGLWLGLAFANGVLIGITFGIGAAWALTTLQREFFNRLSLQGVDLSRVRAAASEGTATGEGAADLFDGGAFDMA